MPREKLKTIAEGIFFSLLNYCIDCFGNVWGLDSYDEENRQSTAFWKAAGPDEQSAAFPDRPRVWNTCTCSPWKQRPAICSPKVCLVHPDVCSQDFTFQKCSLQQLSPQTSSRICSEPPTSQQLQQSRVQALSFQRGILLQGKQTIYQMPTSLPNIEKHTVFKISARKWIQENIPPLPPWWARAGAVWIKYNKINHLLEE